MTQPTGTLEAGTLDPTFADGGVLRVQFPQISGHAASALLALPDKKLIVAIPLSGFFAPLAIARLNEDGTLDTEFGGKGAGYVEIDLGAAHMDTGFSLSATSDGGWLVLSHYQMKDIGDSDAGLVLVRQHKDGRLDESFGERGVRLIPYHGMDSSGYPEDTGQGVRKRSPAGLLAPGHSGASVVQQMDGKIVLVSTLTSPSGGRGIVLRLDPDGSADKTFNGTGFAIVELKGVSYDWSTSFGVAVQEDGKILACGNYVGLTPLSMGAYVTRFDATGQVDASFNGGTVTVRSSDRIELTTITIRERDGGVIAAGRAVLDQVSNGLIVVLTAGGFFDFSFNRGRPLFSKPLLQGLEWVRCIPHPSENSMFLSGSTGRWVTEDLKALTARYLGDGFLDPTFNGNGFSVFDEEEGFEDVRDMVVMTDGRLVVCGVTWVDSPSGGPPGLVGGWVIRYLT